MAKPTISKIWAQDSFNRQIFGDNEIATGIEYQGPVVSNQLNGVGYDTTLYIDLLQRSGTGYNPNKNYNMGDEVLLIVVFNNESFALRVRSNQNNNTNSPLNEGTANFDLNVPVYTINGDSPIDNYINTTQWSLVKSADFNYLTKWFNGKIANFRELSVSNQFQLSDNTSDNFGVMPTNPTVTMDTSGQIVVNAVNSSIRCGDQIILNGNSSSYCVTPSPLATGNEVVTAEWCRFIFEGELPQSITVLVSWTTQTSNTYTLDIDSAQTTLDWVQLAETFFEKYKYVKAIGNETINLDIPQDGLATSTSLNGQELILQRTGNILSFSGVAGLSNKITWSMSI